MVVVFEDGRCRDNGKEGQKGEQSPREREKHFADELEFDLG